MSHQITEQPAQLARARGHGRMNVEHLITLVQTRRPIFDASDPLHRNRDAISAIWKEICTEMECKGEFYYRFYFSFSIASKQTEKMRYNRQCEDPNKVHDYQ